MNLFDPKSLWIAIQPRVCVGIGVCVGAILGILFSHLVLSQQHRMALTRLRTDLDSAQAAFDGLAETHDSAVAQHAQVEVAHDFALRECEKRAKRCAMTPVACVDDNLGAGYACYQDKKLADLVMRLGVSCAISESATRDLVHAGQQK